MTDKPIAGDSPPVEDDQPEAPPTETPPTVEELKARLDEKERMIGSQSNEVGELRTKLSDLENKLAFQSHLERPQEEPSPFDSRFGSEEKAEEVSPDYWTNPKKYYDQWYADNKRKEQETLMKKDAEIRTNVQKAESVIDQAMKETPNVFKGITKQEMRDGVYYWLANNWTKPYYLGDAATHRRIATWIMGERTQYKYTPSAQAGVPPTKTEPYVGGKPESADEVPIEVTGLGTEFLRHRPRGPDGNYKETEQEFLKKVRKVQEGR